MTFTLSFGEGTWLLIMLTIDEDSSYHLINVYLVPDGTLCFVYITTVFVSDCKSKGYYCITFTEKETEVQRI